MSNHVSQFALPPLFRIMTEMVAIEKMLGGVGVTRFESQ
jgi:hypothetical protein